MKIYICDDESQIRNRIEEVVHLNIADAQVTEMGDSCELLSRLRTEECDVLLLDIDMPRMSGLEISKLMNEFNQKPLLVYVTSHDELVYESLQFHPFGFVRKEFLSSELANVLKDCEKEIRKNKQHYCFHTAGGEVSLPLEMIQYFETEGNYIQVYSLGNNYRIRETMSALQEELEPMGFVRVHRGFLVNQAVVEIIGVNELKLRDGSSIPIGRNYAEKAKKEIMRYMLR